MSGKRGNVLSMTKGSGVENREPPPAGSAPPPVVDVDVLLGGGREAVLRHAGQDYRLRITSKNKLILTK